jgi:hypothetical protein|tara:strand:- start:3123 stop:3425 length:303 start_codon:yes stop_codon:yes gene_type:complete
MVNKTLIAILTTLTVSGCASQPPQWLTGSDNCAQIGCGKDLSFYPMAPGEADRQAKAVGWDWGKTSSAYPPSDPKHWELLKAEQAAGNTPSEWNKDHLAK